MIHVTLLFYILVYSRYFMILLFGRQHSTRYMLYIFDELHTIFLIINMNLQIIHACKSFCTLHIIHRI